MPYQITEEAAFLRIVFVGDLTPQDVAALADDIAAIEHSRPITPHRLTDFIQVVDLLITYADIHAFVQQRRAQVLRNVVKTAIVAPRPIQSGYARMFQILTTHPQIEIQIFSTVEAAEAWLTSERGDP